MSRRRWTWRHQRAERLLKAHFAGSLDGNTTGHSHTGGDPDYPGVWFNFGAEVWDRHHQLADRIEERRRNRSQEDPT